MTSPTFKTVNGVSLRYDVAGKGPAVCLINGFRLHGGAWPDAFVERLGERFSVITYDCRGTGLSDKPPRDYAVRTMAEDAAGLIGALGYDSAHVLGFSMGGAVAQELAISHPGRVGRLVLFATFPGVGFSVPAPWWVLQRLFDVEGLTPEAAARQAWPVTYSAGFLARNPAAAESQMRREIAHPTPDHAARGQREALAYFSSGLRLGNVRAETLVATGADDELVPPVNSNVLSLGIRKARLEIVQGLGHRAIWEAPVELASLVGDFFSGVHR